MLDGREGQPGGVRDVVQRRDAHPEAARVSNTGHSDPQINTQKCCFQMIQIPPRRKVTEMPAPYHPQAMASSWTRQRWSSVRLYRHWLKGDETFPALFETKGK